MWSAQQGRTAMLVNKALSGHLPYSHRRTAKTAVMSFYLCVSYQQGWTGGESLTASLGVMPLKKVHQPP